MAMAERMLLWLKREESLESTLEELKQHPDASIMLPIDAIEVMDWDFLLGNAILSNPDSISLSLLELLKMKLGADGFDLDQLSSRLWIRLVSAPLPVLPVETLKSGMDLDGRLVQVFGVAHGVCKVGKAEFKRRLRCRECGRAYDIYQKQQSDLPCCCLYGIFDEVVEAASFIPYQVVLLGPVPRLSTRDDINGPLVRVHLHDDLTETINVGDTVSIIGHLYMDSPVHSSSTLPKRKTLFAEININANNVLHSFNLRPPDTTTFDLKWPWSQGTGAMSLDLLVKSFFGSKTGGLLRVSSKHCSMAILMSLVSISNSGNTPEYANLPEAKFSRRQVHLLFTAPISSSSAAAFLQASARYAPRSVYHRPGCKKQLLATLTTSGDPVLHAGSLALSNGGICIVELCKELLSQEELTLLHGAMDNGVISLKNCPELVVPCSSTVWGVHPPTMVRGHGLLSKSKSGGSKDLFHRQVLSKFDIVVPLYDEQCYGDDEIKEFLMEFNRGTLDMSDHDSLKQHIARSSRVTSVSVTEDAQELISKYYLQLRRMPDSEDVSISTLECLLRIACACARVCLRSQVLEVPDATLSIFLFEQTQQLKNGTSLLRHLIDRLAVPSTRDGDESFDQFLKDLHESLKRCMHDPFDRQEE